MLEVAGQSAFRSCLVIGTAAIVVIVGAGVAGMYMGANVPGRSCPMPAAAVPVASFATAWRRGV